MDVRRTRPGNWPAGRGAACGQRRRTRTRIAWVRGAGDFNGLLAVLDPDVVVRTESPDGVREMRGASNWAKGALAFAQQARFMQPALVDRSAGIVLAPGGRLARAVRFTITDGKIVEVEVIADPARLQPLDLAIL